MSSRPLTKRDRAMVEYTFKVNLEGITERECFKDASKDEIKVLVAFASMNGKSVTAEALAEMLDISKARVKAAVALFEESGVLTPCDKSHFLAEVEYEFEPRKNEGKKSDSLGASKSVRDNRLHDMLMEVETLFEKTLTTTETERITHLYTEKGLTIEYILELIAFVKETYKSMSVNRVVQEANKLIAKNVDTHEALEVYIKEKSKEVAGEWIMRELLGIRGRTLTNTERDFFKKWMHEFGYSKDIIGEAYDITVSATGDRSLPYMDSILTGWHDADCKTLEECRTKAEMHKYEGKKKANNSSQKSKKTVEADTPMYTDFNSEDALMRALERSYGDSDSK